MLTDPKKLRTPGGFGFLVSWRDRFRDLDEARAGELAERLLDESGNLTALQQALGQPDATRDELAEWLRGALAAGSMVALRTRRKPPTLDAPTETDLRDLVDPTRGEDEIRPEVTTWLELRVVDELGEPIAGVPIRMRAGDETVVDTNASGIARLEEATTSFGAARIGSASALHDVLRERWSVHRDAPWLEVEGKPHLTVSGPAEPLPEVALQGKTPHTLVMQPRVGRVRIVGTVFDTNKAFVLPEALGLLRDVADLYGDHAGATMLVVGHTDTSGEPDLNLALSLDRARAVSAYLTDDVDAWLAFYEDDVSASQRWGHSEDGLLLERALWGQGQVPAGDPVAAYQAARGLTVDGDLGPNTRRALVADYMSLDGSTLPGSISPVVHGCGESFPLADDGETLDVDPPDGVDDPTDRRVEVLFFDAPLGILPKPPAETSRPGDPSYGVWCRRAAYTRDMLVVRPLALAVRVTDEETGEALQGAEVSLQGANLLGAGSGGKTDVFGVRTFLNVVAGSYHVQAERVGYAQGSAQALIAPGDAASVVLVALAAIAPKLDVELALAFADPGGTPVPLPSSWMFTAVMEDGSEHTGMTEDGGLVRFSIPRSAKAFTLTLETVLGEYVLMKDGGPAEVGSLDDALEHAAAGGRFVRLPPQMTLEHARWEEKGAPTFDGTHFRQLETATTTVGEPGAPAQLLLKPVWQFFAFEFHDRYHDVPATVPGGQSGGHPIVLEGYTEVAMGEEIAPEVHAHCAWSLNGPAGTVHCLPWVTTDPDVPLPSATSMVRFESPADTFVVSEETPGTWAIETLSGDKLEAATKPSAQRLRYYDLPADWRSHGYWVRRAGEAAGDKRRFELRVGEQSSVGSPFRVDLDDFVLGGVSNDFFDVSALRRGLELEDAFAVLDSNLQVHRPRAGNEAEPYFSDPAVLSAVGDPAAENVAAVVDHPTSTRAVLKGGTLFNVGRVRTRPNMMAGKGVPVGARMADRVAAGDTRSDVFLAIPFRPEVPNGIVGTFELGRSQLALLRCCGRAGDTERFGVLQWSRLHLDFSFDKATEPLFKPTPTPEQQVQLARNMIVAVNETWNDSDSGAAATFEFGSPVSAVGHHVVLGQRGILTPDNELTNAKFAVVAGGRSFVSRDASSMLTIDAVKGVGDGVGTAAHELGHLLGFPDEYAEIRRQASRGARGISDRGRSPGSPYDFDSGGMMGRSKRRPRSRYFWWVARWIHDSAKSFERMPAAVHLGGPDDAGALRYSLPTTTAPIPAFYPVAQTPGGGRGRCDVFVYRTGADGFTGALLPRSSKEPFGALAVVRLKFALDFVDDDDFESVGATVIALESLLREHAGLWWNAEAEASIDGESVRTKLLFSPRFIIRTFPSANNGQKVRDRADFIESLRYSGTSVAAPTAAGYEGFVSNVVSSEGVHAEVKVVESGRTQLDDGDTIPRQVLLRTRKGKPKRVQAVRLYAELLGLKSAFAPTGRQFERVLELAKANSPHVVEFQKVKVRF